MFGMSDKINKVLERCGYSERCTNVVKRNNNRFVGIIDGFKNTNEDHDGAKNLANMVNEKYEDFKLVANYSVTITGEPYVSVRGIFN